MAELPFVDTHIHLFDLQDPTLHYGWLQPGPPDEVLGCTDAMKSLRYHIDDFQAETRFHNVSKVVHVQAAIGIADPVRETSWLQAFADRTGSPHGIIAHSNLKAEGIADELERHLECANMRGIRDFSDGDFLRDPAFERGYALLGRYGLVCDLPATLESFAAARGLAARHPSVVTVLEHCGNPQARDEAYFAHWRHALRELAQAENVVVKISGLGMADHRWTIDSIRPWVLTCIETFGVERAVFGTNWPLDRLFSSYGDVVCAYDTITADFSQTERQALFSANAERIYRI